MTTANVNLNPTQYVRINTGKHPITLQAHRDSVRLVFNDVQPAVENSSYHLLGGDDEPMVVEYNDTNIWVLGVTDTSSLTITETLAVDLPVNHTLSLNGDLLVSELTPVIQISSQYDILDNVLVVTDTPGFGSVSIIDSMFTASTSADPAGLAAVVSLRQLHYRTGQGAVARVSAKFGAGQIGNTQQAGLINAENALTFGFNPSGQFGIFHSFDGSVEIQLLTVTTPAVGAETADITVNGMLYLVPLTAGTVNHNADQIAVYLDDNVPGYEVSANQDVVTAVSLVPFPAGAFLFSSATAVATWAQVSQSQNPTTDFYIKAQWNINNASWLDVTKGNEYQIRFSWPFASVLFYVLDERGEWLLVHCIKWSNTKDIPLMTNPTLRVGCYNRNVGNTADVVMQCASIGGFVEGESAVNGATRSLDNIAVGVGQTLTSVITIRNRDVFGGKLNRAEVHPLITSMATESNKSTIFNIIKNATFATDLIYEYEDEQKSIVEHSFDPAILTGGVPGGSFVVSSTVPLVEHFNEHSFILPGDTITIAARVSSGAAADIQSALTWREDL